MTGACWKLLLKSNECLISTTISGVSMEAVLCFDTEWKQPSHLAFYVFFVVHESSIK